MWSIGTLQETYDTICNTVYSSRGKTISSFDMSIKDAMFRAGMTAISDHHRSTKIIRAVSAPTGSGKSTFGLAFASALVTCDPNNETGRGSGVIVVETIRQAEDTFRALTAYPGMSSKVGIWSSLHDSKNSDVDQMHLCDQHGFEPSVRMSKEDLDKYPLCIVTHQAYRGKGHTSYAITYMGRERCLKLIDEQIKLVDIHTVTPGDVLQARDAVLSSPLMTEDANGEEVENEDLRLHIADNLSKLHKELERMHNYRNMATSDGRKPLQAVPEVINLVPSEADEKAILRAQPTGPQGQPSASYELVQRVLKFTHTLVSGCAFMSRHGYTKAATFVGYEYSCPVMSGTLLLDASADFDGVQQVAVADDGNPLYASIAVPRLSYENLHIYLEGKPDWLKSRRTQLKTILMNHKGVKRYTNWVLELVEKHAQRGDKVLCVIHKKVIDSGIVEPDNRDDWQEAQNVNGRLVRYAHWGIGIGSNRWKDADVVVLCGEFHIPRHASIATALSLKHLMASTSTLEPYQSPKQGKQSDVTVLSNGHLARWELQMATRGNARHIVVDANGNGVCGRQKLVVTGEYERWLIQKDILFPGAHFHHVANSNTQMAEQLNGRSALVHFFQTHKGSDEVTFADVKAATGVDLSMSMRRYAGDAEFMSFLSNAGWTYVPGKRGRGNPSVFIRTAKAAA